MGTFFASRRNQVIAGAVALGLVLVILLALALRGPSTKVGVVTSPTASPSPSDSASPSPSASATATPTGAPTAATPLTGTPITASGQELKAQDGTASKPAGPPCSAWVDTGWTLDKCELLFIRSQTPEGSVAYVVERKTAVNAWRVLLLSYNAGDNTWRVRLMAGEDAGGHYSGITVKKAQVSGDAFPEVVVGFRVQGTAQILSYDICELGAGQALTVAAHRALTHGTASVSGSQIVDYEGQGPTGWTRSVIGFGGGQFRILSQSHTTSAEAGDFP